LWQLGDNRRNHSAWSIDLDQSSRAILVLSNLEETGVLAQRSCSMQTVHYATVGFLIACMVWAAVMVLYKPR